MGENNFEPSAPYGLPYNKGIGSFDAGYSEAKLLKMQLVLLSGAAQKPMVS